MFLRLHSLNCWMIVVVSLKFWIASIRSEIPLQKIIQTSWKTSIRDCWNHVQTNWKPSTRDCINKIGKPTKIIQTSWKTSIRDCLIHGISIPPQENHKGNKGGKSLNITLNFDNKKPYGFFEQLNFWCVRVQWDIGPGHGDVRPWQAKTVSTKDVVVQIWNTASWVRWWNCFLRHDQQIIFARDVMLSATCQVLNIPKFVLVPAKDVVVSIETWRADQDNEFIIWYIFVFVISQSFDMAISCCAPYFSASFFSIYLLD